MKKNKPKMKGTNNMSKIGNEARALWYDDQGEPAVYEKEEITITANELEGAMNQWALSRYTDAELEAEIDRRIAVIAQKSDEMKALYFPETFEWLDKAVAGLHPETNSEKPF